MKELIFNLKEGEKTLKMEPFHRTFIHWWNSHKLKAVIFDGPAPWLNSAVGSHPKPFTFIQVYCETCKEKHGIMYLDKFDAYNGNVEDKPLTEIEVREELKNFIT